jgi:flagellar biosynthetic protein FlhB
MADDRTEQPTGKKLNDLRDKGQIPQSRDLLQAASFVAAIGVFAWFGRGMVGTLSDEITQALFRVGTSPLTPLDGPTIGQLAMNGFIQLVRVCGPLAAASTFSVVFVQIVSQRRFQFSTQALTLNWGALNPVNGLKQLGFSQGGYELLKAVVVSTAVVYIGWQTVRDFITTSPTLARVAIGQSVASGWDVGMSMFKKVAVAFVVIGVADYAYQIWRFTERNLMTKQEVKDEQQQSDGNPETKSRVRRVQRMMLRRRMMSAVPQATVVITNPTHYAMALEYHRGETAPRVVAKGKNLVAQRIKEIAREHGVPIVENKPLAQALYKSVDIGDMIPAALFDAVAEVLAYLIRLKQLVL